MLPAVAGAQFVPSHDISTATVAVPAGDVAWIASAGAARAIRIFADGPVAVTAVGVNVPVAHDTVAADARAGNRRRSGKTNFALPLRSRERVFMAENVAFPLRMTQVPGSWRPEQICLH